MRLTLRTMLAYMDDILEPEDATELKQKIEVSDFAANLVQRIRSSIGRLRLAAPRLDARGTSGDANVVAEYLDNTLPAEQVPEFEKTCLESEMHLAEVASCHQILTIVLGEPAEVSPALRARIHRIGTSPDAQSVPDVPPVQAANVPPVQTPAVPPVQPGEHADEVGSGDHGSTADVETAVPADAHVSRARPEVPAYLLTDAAEGTPSRWKPLAITAIIAFLLASVAVLAMGPLNANHPLARLVGLSNTELPGPADAGPVDPGPPLGPDEEETDPLTPDSGAVQPIDTGQPPSLGLEPGGELAGPPSGDTPPVIETTPGTEPPVDGMSRDSAFSTEPGDSAIPELPGGVPSTEPSEPDDAGTQPVVPPTELPGTGQPMPDQPVTALGVGPEPTEVKADVGRYISDQQILARRDENSGSWFSLPARAPLAVGDALLVLPTYRPQILLANAVQLTFAGESRVVLGAPNAAETPTVSIPYGRAVIVTVGRAGAGLHLNCGAPRLAVSLGDAESALALEVRRVQVLGANPEEKDAHQVVELVVSSGFVTLVEDDQQPLRVEAGQKRTLLDQQPGWTTAAGPLPAWINGQDTSDIDRLASTALLSYLQEQRPIALTLNERAEDRRAEVRSLSVRALGCVDYFDPLVAALRDEGQRSSWPVHFETLQRSLARNREAAAQIRESLEKVHGGDAQQPYQMLWGFSQPQLEAGADGLLVASLDHESLDFRVLAFENLRRITGATMLYRPEFPEARRKSSVTRWQEKLGNREIRYKSPPQVLPARPGVDLTAEEPALP